MSGTSRNSTRKTLAFSAVAEMSTGLVLMIDPAIVAAWLLGVDISGVALLLGRCFGIALFALGWACWPGRRRTDMPSPAKRAMLFYNVLIALYLAYSSAAGHLGGVLLWPAVTLHAVVAFLLLIFRKP
jgi:Ca2+/Na+ antiporter